MCEKAGCFLIVNAIKNATTAKTQQQSTQHISKTSKNHKIKTFLLL